MSSSKCGQRSFCVLEKVWSKTPLSNQSPLPKTSEKRQIQAADEAPIKFPDILSDVASSKGKTETVLYLAYGSNLSAETFKGTRGIEPISQLNVLVPSLALTFDLPGIPYIEPCFANTRYRDPSEQVKHTGYHKTRWHKGLVGVVYEVTRADYATIIRTEGGGASYQDITVACYEIPQGTNVVDAHPSTRPFMAHTLFSPQTPGEKPAPGRSIRPDPNYAQASARYLKLITDGAEEHNLPADYREYLHNLRSYRITRTRQRIGQAIFLAVWVPFLLATLTFGRQFADENGRIPAWLAKITNAIFSQMWFSYDNVFKKAFGDGERTITSSEEDLERNGWRYMDEKDPAVGEKHVREAEFVG